MDELTGLRVSLKLLNSDPERPGELELPKEPVTGTIVGKHIGPHSRVHYYVLLDRPLEFDTSERKVTTGNGDQDKRITEHRLTRTVSIYASQDRPSPPQDLLGPSLLMSGRSVAQGVILIFHDDLPQEITLSQWQEEGRKPIKDRDYAVTGCADVLVLRN